MRAPDDRRLVAVVLAMWVTLAVAYGLFFSFSIFLVALLQTFHWSRALTAGAQSASTLVQAALFPLVGLLVDRVGPARVVRGGVVALGASALLAATIHAPWQLYLYTGVLGAAGMAGVGWVPMGVLLTRWFAAHRARVAGIVFSGMGVGVLVVGPLFQALISAHGWRVATAALGAGTLGLLVPVTWWGVREPAAASPVRSDTPPPLPEVALGEALRSRQFWALFFAYACTPLAVFPVATHVVAFAVDVGFPAMIAATVFGIMGFMSTIGRVGFGAIADRLGGPPAATLSFVGTAGGALALVALSAWPHPVWLGVFAVLFGLGFGARGPIITAMASELFAGRRFGLIWGVLNVGNGIAGAIGPWFGGVVHDVTGSYRAAFLATVVFSAGSVTCFWLARRRAP